MDKNFTEVVQSTFAEPLAAATPEVDGAMPWGQETYSTKRHGFSINNCESEPIRTPGCIQAHGALLVLRCSDLSVLQASENTLAILGHKPLDLLGHSVAAVVNEEGAIRLRSMLATEQTDRNPIYAFTLPANDEVAALDVTLHTIDGAAILEFEAAVRSQRAAGTMPHSLSQNANPDYYSFIKKSVTRIQTADTVQEFCQALAEEVRVLSSLDRVMIYKFHPDNHGEVVAESRLSHLVPWVGLHYPAADIPKSARDIFAKTWIRPVPDMHCELAEMIPRANPDTGQPIDMIHCALRGVSAMYTEYSKNMGVAASLTMSLRRESVLWGLIICHRYSGPSHVPYELRAACEFLAQVASLQYRAVEDRENATYRLRLEEVNQKLLSIAAQEGGLASMTDGEPSLLSAMHASGAALFHRDRWWRVGSTPTESQLEALGQWVVGRLDVGAIVSSVYVTHSLATDYPAGAEFADVASGVLAAPLSRSGQNLMMWFRPEVEKTVNWGGNPHDDTPAADPGDTLVRPRHSFEPFSESVFRHATPWLEVEIDAVSRLRALIMELVIVRAERLAGLNADLARSNEELDAFAYVASHDLKEPLRGISKYAHQLMEAGSPDEDDKRKLEGLLRLTLRMDSLLDSLLHFSRVGREELTLENVDMNDVLGDAMEMIGSRTSDGRTQIVAPRRLPPAMCDRVRVREVLVNLLSNAVKYNDKADKRVEVNYVGAHEASLRRTFPPGSEGQTVYYVRDNGIGIASRHFEQVFKMFKRLHGREEFGGGTGAGLTIVRKLVERHRGQVWIDSIAGEGSTFFFTTSRSDET
ncbi:ATP-binding protein [Actimicrobium antarcticum]|uniref:histidine kinase n=1 Tax=Actimicrobium antarcticum TaxID=1051899 RepID=A0ABP7SRX1_9BURK